MRTISGQLKDEGTRGLRRQRLVAFHDEVGSIEEFSFICCILILSNNISERRG